MGEFDRNIQLDAEFNYQSYAPPVVPLIAPSATAGTTPVTTINGVSGPSIIFDGGSTGYGFNAAGSSVVFTLSNPTTVRTALSAAKSGVNTDITQLNGASQADVTTDYKVAGTKVVGAQGAAIPDAAGGVTIDTEARAALNTLLAELRTHGLIAP